MKKLTAVILIMALLVPVAALAADPIVGCWYMMYDKTLLPEFADTFQNYDLIVAVYSFMENGTIIGTENDIKDGVSNASGQGVGKWEKELFGYKYSIVGMGSGDAKLKDGYLYIQTSGGPYLRLRKMEPYSPYTDYEY